MVKMGYIKQNIVQHIKENLTGYIIALVFFLIGISSAVFIINMSEIFSATASDAIWNLIWNI